MNTNYDDEATRYEGTSSDEAEVKTTEKSGWKHAAVGAGSGLLIGSVATVLMGMKSPDTEPEPTHGKLEDDNHRDVLSNPEWVDDNIQVATTVSDDMSFGHAFAAARTEVGAGGCFEWHGNVYGTYTAEEWNHMTAAERTEWSDHFSWNHIDHSSSTVAQHSTKAHSDHTAHTQTPQNTADDIEVVSVDHNEVRNDIAQNNTHQSNSTLTTSEDTHTASEEVVVENAEPEVEILGVVHDYETGANIGGLSVDGQEVILIDVDGNMEFDYIATDLNANDMLDDGEMVDIQGQGLTVNDIGGFTDPADNMYASNDAPDYSSDVYEV